MPNDIQTVLQALRDIGHAVVNIRKEVEETRKGVAELRRGLFGPGPLPMASSSDDLSTIKVLVSGLGPQVQNINEIVIESLDLQRKTLR